MVCMVCLLHEDNRHPHSAARRSSGHPSCAGDILNNRVVGICGLVNLAQ
jgi:hypothetical protein